MSTMDLSEKALVRATASTFLVAFLAVVVIPEMAVAIAPLPSPVPTDGLYCTDRHGNRVPDGSEYMPEVDPCKKCQCLSGDAVMCRSVLCLPPPCSMYESSKNECCEFRCIQPSLDIPKNNGNSTNHVYTMLKDANGVNLSIRLVASAVTSLLIIALLIFMIHRLRQRRLLIAMRRLNNDRRSLNEALAYMTNIDQLDIGFEFPPYEDPPPPYSPPKPHDGVPAEDPPPYELTPNHQVETDGLAVGSAGAEVPMAEVSNDYLLHLETRQSQDVPCLNEFSSRPSPVPESFNSELIELNHLNPDALSVTILPSPVSKSQQDTFGKPSKCASNYGSRSAQVCNVTAGNTNSHLFSPADDPTLSAVDCWPVECATMEQFTFNPVKFDPSFSQVMVKMQRQMAHSSLVRSENEISLHPCQNRQDEIQKKSKTEQSSFQQIHNCQRGSPEYPTVAGVYDPLGSQENLANEHWNFVTADNGSSQAQRNPAEDFLYTDSYQSSHRIPRKKKKVPTATLR